jgi:hypothetical protein
MKATEEIINISSEQLSSAPIESSESLLVGLGSLGAELAELLSKKNGFFTFEASLHVYSSAVSKEDALSIQNWNSPGCWRNEYGQLVPASALFFAQDAFGNQFAFSGGEVKVFCAESAEFISVGTSLEAWATEILEDWRNLTGFYLAHDWQIANRPLQKGERLIPKIPFVIGGPHNIENLYAGEITRAMRFRASIARQIANLPDGMPVTLKIT